MPALPRLRTDRTVHALFMVERCVSVSAASAVVPRTTVVWTASGVPARSAISTNRSRP
jgi:hypothetical protein